MDKDDLDRISGVVVNAAINVHRKLGPGLLERVYETILAGILKREGFNIDRSGRSTLISTEFISRLHFGLI